MAITGPFYHYKTEPGLIIDKMWYKGGRETRKPLKHHSRHYASFVTKNGFLQRQLHFYPKNQVYRMSIGAEYPDSHDFVFRQAYDKFVSKAHGKVKASLGTSLVEFRQSLKMVDHRATQLLDFTLGLARRDFKRSVRALGIVSDVNTKRRRAPKGSKMYEFKAVWEKQAVKPSSFANNYLEFAFGWAPLVDDIQSAVSVLGRPFDAHRVKTRAAHRVSSSVFQPRVEESAALYPTYEEVYDELYKLQLVATVRVSNPNVLLAKELGLINPVQTAWNVVPYSFLIDAFVPIGRFLESFTDFAGLELEDGVLSRTWTGSNVRTEHWLPEKDYGRHTEVYEQYGHNFERLLVAGFDIPRLQSRVTLPVFGLLGRATSTVALLIQQLSQRK